MLEVRLIREAEYDAYFNMTAQAFRAGAARARRSRQWSPMEELRGVYEDGQLKAGLKVIDIPIWMGRTTLLNGAITAVASPPENRRRGYIGQLLHGLLEELREKNVPIATLYPFSFPFYKRFGWEQVEDKYEYKIPVDRLPQSNIAGTWQPISRSTDFDKTDPQPISDEDLAALMDVHRRWCEGRTGPLARDAHMWRRGMLQEGAEERPDVYLWRDPNGTPRAYVIYAFEQLENRWTRRLVVWDHAALDIEALKATLTFLRNHDSQAKEVAIDFPAGFPFLAMFDDPEFKTEVEAGFMLRLVDIPQALTARAYPTGVSSQVTLTVSDSFCEWNNGTFTLSVREGAGLVQKAMSAEAPESNAPGMRLDQKTLAQLYTGYLTATRAASIGLLDATDPAALQAADLIFQAPLPFMPDHF